MELKEIITNLENHNAWRRGNDDIEMIHPTFLGETIDEAIKLLKKIKKT